MNASNKTNKQMYDQKVANNAEIILEFKQVLKTLACGSHIMCINWFFLYNSYLKYSFTPQLNTQLSNISVEIESDLYIA